MEWVEWVDAGARLSAMGNSTGALRKARRTVEEPQRPTEVLALDNLSHAAYLYHMAGGRAELYKVHELVIRYEHAYLEHHFEEEAGRLLAAAAAKETYEPRPVPMGRVLYEHLAACLTAALCAEGEAPISWREAQNYLEEAGDILAAREALGLPLVLAWEGDAKSAA